MDLYSILLLAICAFIVFVFFKKSIKLGIHALSGFIGIFILNFILSLINLHIPYNFVTVLIAGIMGIPGLILLSLYYILL
ncbi:pro-sigmaK processing inhibitor BofA family protein [uncultured Finegoldia sp.]|uniref:pro-sigmaK processing inhibitor BofA family protein n=1 Tax=uncultured Finegoldia sp. TaxID=328009 RepID=UPI002626C8EA|nr:pro-sigmaK processing inhibitor BofA family protein [uncultured Finegoldia sp.]